MMSHTIFFIATVLLFPSLIQSISVIGPRVLRPFNPYHLSIHGGSRPYTLYVAIEGRKANGELFNQGREVQVPAASSKLVTLFIDDPGPGQYSLRARSTSGPLFASSAPLLYQPRSFCVFVETDKRVYKPGDTINFRVIGLDKYLLPLTSSIDISVLDSGGTPVREWANIPLDRGILSNELLLADEPALGEWTIQVEVKGQKYSKQVLIADYVTPNFQMDIQMPKQLLFSEGRFNINVTAKHFNGMPVRGELTISAYAVFFSGLLQPVFSSPSRKVVEFSGSVSVPYDLKTDLDLAEDAARPLVIEAVLEEKKTLTKQNITSKILLLRTPYRLKITAPDYFKPTLPYIVQIEVLDPYGQIMNTSGDVAVERLWDDGAPVNITTVHLVNGQATYMIIPDKDHSKSILNLVIRYNEVSERVINVISCAPTDDQFLTVEVLTRSSVNGEMRVRITATEPMDLLHYAIIGRGDILLAKTLDLSSPRRTVDVPVPVTESMAPGSVVLAWFPRANGSVLASAVYAPHDNLLPHQVSVKVSGAGYKPGGSVEFLVEGESGAHAALLAQDSAAAEAKLANDEGFGSGLSMETVEREAESFSGLKHSVYKNEDRLPFMGLDLGGNHTADVFQNAGLVILTDGFVMRSIRSETAVPEPPETGTRPPLAGPYAFSRLPPPPSPRYYLTVTPQPTWMLANFSIGFDGKGVETGRSPLSPAEWTVGAFAVHPTLGLGLATPKKFTTSVPLTMTADLPVTMQRGETLAAIITLKSTLTVDTTVDVTFHNSEQYFEFEPLENNVESSKKIELFRRSRITVPARGVASTAFLVTVTRTGEANVIAEVSGNGVSASLFRTIDVKDGYEEELWSLRLLDGRRGVGRGNVSLMAAAGTQVSAATLLAAGDVLAPALRAARNPPTPAADPPHALAPLALATVILDYLQAVERERDEVALTQEARVQAATGYQRLMAYRRPDGSFSSELDADAEGDVWATAVSARWLSRAARYVPTSGGAGAAAARWVARAQLADGSWPQPARRNDPAAQAPVPLASYALMALMQAHGSEQLYRNEINKALKFLVGVLSPDLDPYSLAIAAAVLADAKHPEATNALDMLDKYANRTDSSLFWSRGEEGGVEARSPWVVADSASARAAAWGLRALLAAPSGIEGAAPAALVNHLMLAFRPHDLDPDVLDSLALFSKSVKTSNKLRVTVNVTGSEEPRQFNIDESNALIVQTQQVRNARGASAVSSGRGVCVVGLSARARTNVTGAWPRYTLDPRVDQVSTKDRIQLSICIGFVALGNDTESGLAMLTVQLPSGYQADINTITELMWSRSVVGARALRGGRVAAWLRVSRAERCVTLAAPRALPVARARPGYAALQDIYDSSHRARAFFYPVPVTACDVCQEWASCARACGASAGQMSPAGSSPAPPAPDRGAATTAPFAALILALAAAVSILR